MTVATKQQSVAPVPADDRFATGRFRPLIAYDESMVPPPRPAGGPGAGLVAAPVDVVLETVDVQCRALLPTHMVDRTVRWTGQLLGWLARFPGQDWEVRWLACGADAAPRRWAEVPAAAGVGSRRDHVTPAMYALLMARVLRPSYSWLLNSLLSKLVERFTVVNDPEGFGRLRALPAYRSVLQRHQLDAEAALVRVMLRTGKPLMGLTGEDLLAYAELVRASGRCDASTWRGS